MVESRFGDSWEDLDGVMPDGSVCWCFGLDVGDDVVGCLPVDLEKDEEVNESVRTEDLRA